VLQVSNADKFVAELLSFLGCQIEKAVDELNLSKKIISCHPSNLPRIHQRQENQDKVSSL
jgi:hypothetical protein